MSTHAPCHNMITRDASERSCVVPVNQRREGASLDWNGSGAAAAVPQGVRRERRASLDVASFGQSALRP